MPKNAVRLDHKYGRVQRTRGAVREDKADFDAAVAAVWRGDPADPNKGKAYRAVDSPILIRGPTMDAASADAGAAPSPKSRTDDCTIGEVALNRATLRTGWCDQKPRPGSHRAKNSPSGWPYACEWYLGRRTPEATLAAPQPDDRCEAQFYIGAMEC